MFARRKTEEELAAEKAAFEALPLIEQIRLVIRQEVRAIVAEELRLSKMPYWERDAYNRQQQGYSQSQTRSTGMGGEG